MRSGSIDARSGTGWVSTNRYLGQSVDDVGDRAAVATWQRNGWNRWWLRVGDRHVGVRALQAAAAERPGKLAPMMTTPGYRLHRGSGARCGERSPDPCLACLCRGLNENRRRNARMGCGGSVHQAERSTQARWRMPLAAPPKAARSVLDSAGTALRSFARGAIAANAGEVTASPRG
jgi:hypothetical protein